LAVSVTQAKQVNHAFGFRPGGRSQDASDKRFDF
jgi:hypothetical protein